MSAQILPFIRRPLPEPQFIEEPDDLIDEAVTSMVASLVDSGYEVVGGHYVQDIALVVESVKALVYRVEGKSHGLHKISNNIAVTDKEPDAAYN